MIQPTARLGFRFKGKATSACIKKGHHLKGSPEIAGDPFFPGIFSFRRSFFSGMVLIDAPLSAAPEGAP